MAFGRKPYVRPPLKLPEVPETPPPVRAGLRMYDGRARATVQVPKKALRRSEAYRRVVASLPCIHCGLWGRSQAAHPNTDKGAGIKTDDRECFPLCADGPDYVGCHTKFDQGALFDKSLRRSIEVQWGNETAEGIEAEGLWPESLPRWG